MKIKKILLIMGVTSFIPCYGQFENLDIIGRYENAFKAYENNTIYNSDGLIVNDYTYHCPSGGNSNYDCDDLISPTVITGYSYYLNSNLGNVGFGVMESLLDMYEITGDKAYLYKFMDYYIIAQGQKQSTKYWYHNNNFQFNGRILAAFAHFAYIVYSDNNLWAEPIYEPSSFLNKSTFGAFATDVYQSIDETLTDVMDHYNTLWNPYTGMRNVTGDISIPAQLNYQSPWGCAFLYAYLVSVYANNENTDYAYATKIIVSNYFSQVEDYTNSFRWVLQYWAANNSYYWSTYGWQPAGTNLIYEDIGHGQLDIQFPILFYKLKNEYLSNYNNCSGCNAYFSDNDMVYFRNTITENLLDTKINNTPIFFVRTDGSNGSYNQELFQPTIMGWMRFHDFDDYNGAMSPNTVYDLIGDYYEYEVEPSTIEFNSSTFDKYFNGIRMRGVAYIAEAQWENECPNLILRNRDLVYDQDFYSYYDLTVDPSVNEYDPNNQYNSDEKSFAEPILTTQNFIIRDGVTSSMEAVNSIVLKPGFHAENGSSFHASINPGLCSQSKSFIIEDNASQDNLANNFTKENISISSFSVFPNPSDGTFTLTSNVNISEIEIADIAGKIVYAETNLFQKNLNVNISFLPKGYYILKGKSENGPFSKKLILQ